MSVFRAAARLPHHAALSDVIGLAALIALIALGFGAGAMV